jgi:hypothetical protein
VKRKKGRKGGWKDGRTGELSLELKFRLKAKVV